MKTITYTLPNEEAIELGKAICEAYNYQEEIEDGIDGDGNPIMIPNPETVIQFVHRQGALFFKRHYKAWKNKKRKEAQQEEADAEPPLDIT